MIIKLRLRWRISAIFEDLCTRDFYDFLFFLLRCHEMVRNRPEHGWKKIEGIQKKANESVYVIPPPNFSKLFDRFGC